MSSASSGIAGSVSQALNQQGQVARAKDAVKNHDDRMAQKLRELRDQATQEVADTEHVDAVLRTQDQQPHDDRNPTQQQQQDQTPDGITTDKDGQTHIDLKA